jgi:hypothetical protein
VLLGVFLGRALLALARQHRRGSRPRTRSR